MASQRVFVFALGGKLAESLAEDLARFQKARMTNSPNEWSHEDWPLAVRDQIDFLVTRLIAAALEPPVLYRCEHVDCWSMGDVYKRAFTRGVTSDHGQLLTNRYEVLFGWTDRSSSRKNTSLPSGAPSESRWLAARLNEAAIAWMPLVDRRVILLIRIPLGGLWTYEEVTGSLGSIPTWWHPIQKNVD